MRGYTIILDIMIMRISKCRDWQELYVKDVLIEGTTIETFKIWLPADNLLYKWEIIKRRSCIISEETKKENEKYAKA